MNRTLYSLLFTLFLPLIFVRLAWRSLSAPDYRRGWSQRLGLKQPWQRDTRQPVIWFHAVSMGETAAASSLISQTLTAFPNHKILVTNMTPTGAAQVRRQFAEAMAQGRVVQQYLPYDLPWVINGFLKRVNPDLLVIVETELWPNLLFYCQRRQIPVALANGRMNPKSAARYLKFDQIRSDMMSALSGLAVQSEADAEQFQRLGVPSEKIRITGNLKFDKDLPKEQIEAGKQWREQIQRPVFLAASTNDGEETPILAAYQQLRKSIPDLLLVLVPRHPERFPVVENMLSEYRFITRSSNAEVTPETQILLGDTLGEMMYFYAMADAAFVGASLVPNGGHNPIEPAALGVPTVMGPHVFKCADLCRQLTSSGGLTLVNEGQELADVLKPWLINLREAKRIGIKGQQVVEENRGSTQRQLELLKELVKG